MRFPNLFQALHKRCQAFNPGEGGLDCLDKFQKDGALCSSLKTVALSGARLGAISINRLTPDFRHAIEFVELSLGSTRDSTSLGCRIALVDISGRLE
jgi:hypothetical protein